jgi:hypothetical protein
MPNNGAISQTLTTTTKSYTIPKGYHDGSGKVSIAIQTKTVTPSKSTQPVTPKNGYVLGSVTVEPIPDRYIITTDATASANEIMSGETAYVNGSKVTGTFSIDSELTTQDNLIAELQSLLDGKTSGGDSGRKVISVSCPDGYSIYGFDVNGNPLEVTGGTGEFLEGIVKTQTLMLVPYGDVVGHYSPCMFKFLSNGGGFRYDPGSN